MGYLNSEKSTIAAIDDEGWFHSGDIGRIDKVGSNLLAEWTCLFAFVTPFHASQDGFLYITGRMKGKQCESVICLYGQVKSHTFQIHAELILMSGGDNVAPVPIEDRIKKEVPFLSNVMVIGENRKDLTCLVTLKVIVIYMYVCTVTIKVWYTDVLDHCYNRWIVVVL